MSKEAYQSLSLDGSDDQCLTVVYNRPIIGGHHTSGSKNAAENKVSINHSAILVLKEQNVAFIYKCSAVAEMGDRLVTIHVGRKLGALPFFGGGAGSQSNTMWPGPRPTFLPSGILIHPAIWPR